MSRTKTSPWPTVRVALGRPKLGNRMAAGVAGSCIAAMALASGTKWRISPLGVSRNSGPNWALGSIASITAIDSFLRLTGRAKGWAMPLVGSIKANSSPMKRQPFAISSADSVDLPEPDSPVRISALPSFSTVAAWSNRKRRSPSAICRFIAISAAIKPWARETGRASGSI